MSSNQFKGSSILLKALDFEKNRKNLSFSSFKTSFEHLNFRHFSALQHHVWKIQGFQHWKNEGF